MTPSITTRRCTLVLALAAQLAMPTNSSAAVSPKLEEWAKGPAQWIMTRDEKRAWSKITIDDEAIGFIDLFWARRDPTTGTSRNEFREEFDRRVKLSDEKFREDKKRGALTDRGRVFIVLGAGTNMGTELGQQTSQRQSTGDVVGDDPTGGRKMATRETWVWEHADAKKFGMPKIQVVFIQEAYTRSYRRDPQRTDFGGAEPVAIRKAIVNPGLTELPPWAARGGVEPQIKLQPAVVAPLPSVPAGAGAVAGSSGKSVLAIKGASRLTLLKNVVSIDAQSDNDPFLSMKPVSAVKAGSELGWAAQYCSGTPDVPPVHFNVRVHGTSVSGEKVDSTAAPDEQIPDPIDALGGCHLLRGAVSLAGMSQGTYELEVTVDDPIASKSHYLRQGFKIE